MNNEIKTIKNIISKELCEFLALEFEMMNNVCEIIYSGQKLSDLCDNTFARYSPLMFEALSVKLLPQIEEAVGKKLYPTYSYARIYYKDSFLQKHYDRESSEVTVSICIQQESNWPLYVKDDTGEIHQLDFEVGDAGIYSGRKYEHWRDPLQNEKHIQCFLQYVSVEGNSAWLKWDTRPCLGLPYEWTNQAVKNELENIKKLLNK